MFEFVDRPPIEGAVGAAHRRTVRDLPHRRPPAPDDESGRGLLLVEALADRWGVKLGPAPRKTVWAELDLPTS